MDITKIQKIVRKAIKDYSISAKYDEEILVSFLSVDIFREMNSDDLPAPAPRPPVRKPATLNALGNHGEAEGATP